MVLQTLCSSPDFTGFSVYVDSVSLSAAIRSTADTAGRPSRKDMEREVASGMLVTRLAESGTHWQRNRYSVQ